MTRAALQAFPGKPRWCSASLHNQPRLAGWKPLPLTLILLLGLYGCSSQPRPPTELPPQALENISWEQRQQQLLPLTQWQVLGKINIRTDQDNTTANLSWWQNGDHYKIYMAGPLGQGAVNINGSDQLGITLNISGEEQLHAPTPERLLDQQLGWSVPVSQMPYWIRGLPAPQSNHSKVLDPYNRLQQLAQHGWIINYLHYQPEQQHLPRKIELRRGNNLKLTLILKQWHFISTPLNTNS